MPQPPDRVSETLADGLVIIDDQDRGHTAVSSYTGRTTSEPG
jgi:hypothetical protein